MPKESVMDATSSFATSNGAGNADAKAEPGRILLIELTNLLSLFFTHTRNAKGARATAVLFDQLVGRLNILNKIPGHESGLILRRIGHGTAGIDEKPDYFFMFGNFAFRGSEATPTNGQHARSSHHLTIALEQALDSFNDLGIYSFFLQLPGVSPEKKDQLRFALNILSRFRLAVGNSASITFRYFGRAVTVPLIRDSNGIPDPNLTMVAGLNGLSAVNMREIIKQAVAFCKLAPPPEDEGCTSEDYNKIFSVRSLRSQLIQPLVEINNLPWMKADDIALSKVQIKPIEGTAENPAASIAEEEMAPSAESSPSSELPIELTHAVLNLDSDTSKNDLDDVDHFFDFDFDDLSPELFGKHITMVTRLIYEFVSKDDLDSVERLLNIVRERFEKVPENAICQLEVQRQSVKIGIQGRRFIVGMVHPRLLGLISFKKEQIRIQQKIDTIGTFNAALFESDNDAIERSFEISKSDAGIIKGLLRSCFSAQGKFNKKSFVSIIGELSRYGCIPFEILWCITRQALIADERMALINSIPLLLEKLKNLESALRFLLVDIYRHPMQIDLSDRNALALAILLLRTLNKERDIDINCTPEEVLSVRKSLNTDVISVAAGYLDINPSQIRNKFRTLRSALKSSVSAGLSDASTDALEFNFLLAMEREGLIFMALVGGDTARSVIRDALSYYGNPASEIFQQQVSAPLLSDLMGHLRIVLRCITRQGQLQDLENLKMIERSAVRLMALHTDPGYTQKVRQTLKCVEPAIRAIQVRPQ